MSRHDKGITSPAPRDVVVAMRRLSKNAVIDLALDAIAAVAGIDSCEPVDLTVALVADFANPRLAVRGDRGIQ